MIRKAFVTGPIRAGIDRSPLAAFEMEAVPPGSHKACDIHLGIELNLSSAESCDALEDLRMASFDRQGEQGVRRIYTVTCESYDDGEAIYETLYSFIRALPGFIGKIKLEETTRYLRHPTHADGLPIVTVTAASRWLNVTQERLSEATR
jgi:hypothetical protein